MKSICAAGMIILWTVRFISSSIWPNWNANGTGDFPGKYSSHILEGFKTRTIKERENKCKNKIPRSMSIGILTSFKKQKITGSFRCSNFKKMRTHNPFSKMRMIKQNCWSTKNIVAILWPVIRYKSTNQNITKLILDYSTNSVPYSRHVMMLSEMVSFGLMWESPLCALITINELKKLLWA